MKYECVCCNYKTDCRNSWYAHKKSRKHIVNSTNNNTNNINQNQIDSLIQKSENELLKEKLKSIENEKNMVINQLKETRDQYENQLRETKNQLKETKDQYEDRLGDAKYHYETLKYENEFHKRLINSAGGLIQKTMNTMSYLLLNYNNAPCLTHLSDYSIISKNIDYLVNDLIHYHKKNKLDKHIGDFIVQQYKKKNPELQSIWSSDVDRLNYFIRELINDTNQTEPKIRAVTDKNKIIKNNKDTDIKFQWIVDKKGIKVTEYIIDPLLNYIGNINTNYLQQKNKEINEKFNIQNDMKILEDLQVVASISCDIKNKTLSQNINKYIAPHFYLEKVN